MDHQPVPERKKLTVREAADRCGVNYDTFLSWVKKGACPHILVGPAQSIRVFEDDVRLLIEIKN
jgi:excisionase family DNA binding protein